MFAIVLTYLGLEGIWLWGCDNTRFCDLNHLRLFGFAYLVMIVSEVCWWFAGVGFWVWVRAFCLLFCGGSVLRSVWVVPIMTFWSF